MERNITGLKGERNRVMRTNNDTFKPRLTRDQFEKLHEDCDKARGKFVRVEKQAVERLLMDHSSLFAIAEIRDE